MKAVLAAGRFWLVLFWSTVSFVQTPVVRPILAWSSYWMTHRSSILLLTGVNTAITTASEAGTRFLWPVITGQEEHAFLVRTETGGTRIHTQSLISIFMTLFASLLGGPVYFLRQTRHRFLFFVAFGTFNSILSQSLVSLFRDGFMHLAAARLFFDFFYNGSVKFLLFETTRRPLLKRSRCFFSLASIRGIQDFLTTSLRVAMISLLGLKG